MKTIHIFFALVAFLFVGCMTPITQQEHEFSQLMPESTAHSILKKYNIPESYYGKGWCGSGLVYVKDIRLFSYVKAQQSIFLNGKPGSFCFYSATFYGIPNNQAAHEVLMALEALGAQINHHNIDNP